MERMSGWPQAMEQKSRRALGEFMILRVMRRLDTKMTYLTSVICQRQNNYRTVGSLLYWCNRILRLVTE